MKKIEVSESALQTIKNMSVCREDEINMLKQTLKTIKEISQNQEISKSWVTVESLCTQALIS